MLTWFGLCLLLLGWPGEDAGHARLQELEPPVEEQSRFLMDAIELCRRGDHLIDDDRPEALRQARELFAAAAEQRLDEACGAAGLSWTLSTIYSRRIEEDDDLIARAVSTARHAVEADPASASAWAALARAKVLDLDLHAANQAAETALSKDPDSVLALRAAALVRIARGQIGPAREAIERAMALQPGVPSIHLTMGNVHLLSGHPAPAIAEFKKALVLSPGWVPARLQLASALEKARRFEAAGLIFRKLLAEHPETSARANLLMGHSLMKRSRWRRALVVLGRSDFKTHRGICNGTVVYLQGLCHLRLHELDAARAAFRRVIEQYPDATSGYARLQRLVFNAYEQLGRLALEANDPEAAAAVMEEGIQRTGASLDLYLRLAGLYQDFHLPEEASSLLQQAVGRELEPGQAEQHLQAYTFWARIARDRGDEESLDRLAASLDSHARSILDLGDFVADLEAMRAMAIADHGRQALAWLRHAVDLGYDHLGWIADDPELESLRQVPAFHDLLVSARGGSPASD
ncbi:MAG: tetratricopeptide repeat protein [Acidobacteriota bacterium]